MSLNLSQMAAIFEVLDWLGRVAHPNDRPSLSAILEPIFYELRFGFEKESPERSKSAGYSKGDKISKITSEEITVYEDHINGLPARILLAAMSVTALGEACTETLESDRNLDMGAIMMEAATEKVLKDRRSHLRRLIDGIVEKDGSLIATRTSCSC